MRELEFLPDWYPRLRKRKRLVGVQAYATGVLIGGLCLWGWLSGRNIQSASASIVVLQGEISQADNELKRLDEAVKQKQQLDAKNQILKKVGYHVEVTKALAAIETAMPDEMALVALASEVREVPRQMPGLAAASAAQNNQVVMDRRLELSVTAVGPTDATLARFMMNLSKTELFDRINLSLSSERKDANRVMREFTITFGVDLNRPAALVSGGAGAGLTGVSGGGVK